MDTRLLLIDPQNDFCNPNGGTLFVPGAESDMDRIAAMVDRLGPKLNRIHTTLDQHHVLAIFHPIFIVDRDGNHPITIPDAAPPLISVEGIQNGDWRATHPAFQDYLLFYAQELEKKDRYVLCIWPYHCLIGTPGANVVSAVSRAFLDWEKAKAGKMVEYVSKGSNFKTEHYSAVQAEVPDPQDPTTNLNLPLIQTLEEADVILTGGEALSHCWKNTILDIANQFDDSSISKFMFLEDASSSVTGFEKDGEEFVHEMIGRGMQVSTTDKVRL